VKLKTSICGHLNSIHTIQSIVEKSYIASQSTQNISILFHRRPILILTSNSDKIEGFTRSFLEIFSNFFGHPIKLFQHVSDTHDGDGYLVNTSNSLTCNQTFVNMTLPSKDIIPRISYVCKSFFMNSFIYN
jgi:hypothetical protein